MKKPKQYSVYDLQDCDFMKDTWTEPLTANELRQRYWCLEEGRTTHYKYFTMDWIQEFWEVRFIEFGTDKWAKISDDDIIDIPF